MELRRCNRCQKTLPLDKFRKDPRVKSGLKTECNDCNKSRVYAWRKTEKGKESAKRTLEKYNHSEQGRKKRAAYRQTPAMKEARKRWKQSEAGKASEKRYRQSANRKRVLKTYAQSEKGKEALSRSAKTENGKARLARGVHKRRILLADPVSDLTAQEWKDIKDRYNNRCAYCDKVKPLTMDHVTPLSKGGKHTARNVVPACRSCNAKKRDKILSVLEISDLFVLPLTYSVPA